MPLYAFECSHCGQFDAYREIGAPLPRCPGCHEDETVRKLITAPALCFPAHLREENVVSRRQQQAWLNSDEVRQKRDSGEYRSPSDSLSDIKRNHREARAKEASAKRDAFIKEWGKPPIYE